MALTIDAAPRQDFGRHVHALRRRGSVPAVLYGHRQQPLALATEAKTLDRVWHHAGRSQLVDLRVDGGQVRKVLIRELQRHPRSGHPIHVDFFAVNLREKLAVDVPVVVLGESPAVTEEKIGQVLQTITQLRVECLPGNIPAQLTVDISGLVAIDDHITISQVALPEGVTLAHAATEGEDPIIVKIAPLRVREELEAAVPAAEGEPAAAEGEAGGEAEGQPGS